MTREVVGPGERQAAIDAIAAVVNSPRGGRPVAYEDASEWEMRQLYAEAWVDAGFVSAADVSPWIEENVCNAGVALAAHRAGFRPSDPWVERSPAAYAPPAKEPLITPGPLRGAVNRARARTAWRQREKSRAQVAARVAQDLRETLDLLRSLDYDAGFGVLALDLSSALGGPAGPNSEADVLRAYNEFSLQVHVLQDRLGALPSLAGDEQTATSGELRFWLDMAAVIEGGLDWCAPSIGETISGDLGPRREWLTLTLEHYA